MSIIARGTVASVAVKQASASIAAKQKLDFCGRPYGRYEDHKWKGNPPCDDAFVHGNEVLAVFDGVGEQKYRSGRAARTLARHVDVAATGFPLANSKVATLENYRVAGYNRAYDILDTAFYYAVQEVNNPPDKQWKSLHGDVKKGSTTALVLGLIRMGDARCQIHEASFGDCQWAHFRLGDDQKYTCIYVSQRGYHVNGTQNPAPYQLHLKGDDCLESFDGVIDKMLKGSHDVVEGDIILAASDGFFDNFFAAYLW